MKGTQPESHPALRAGVRYIIQLVKMKNEGRMLDILIFIITFISIRWYHTTLPGRGASYYLKYSP